MQPYAQVINAVAEASTVANHVKDDQLGGATPCRDWDVKTLANHLLQVVTALSLAGRHEPVPPEHWSRQLMSDQWAAQFDEEARAATALWYADASAWQSTVAMGGAEVPGAMVATMLAADLVIHGWDLASATGQEYRCDGDTAEMTRQFLVDTGDQGRSMGIFAAPVPVPKDAAALDRALGLSGRDPRWTP